MAKKTQSKIDDIRFGSNDIMILVTGLVGSGKSSFINTLLEKKRMAVGETLKPCTTEIDYQIIDVIPGPNFHGRRLVIVDTPGLNNILIDDNKILGDIVEWVENSCVKIAGVIYLYDIFPDRHASISKGGLTALRASFQNSEGALERIILVTTKWDKNGIYEGEARENELKARFWKYLVDRGSQVKRFKNSSSSAWEIVNALLIQAGEDDVLDVRSQLAELRTKLDVKKKSNTKKDIFTLLRSIFRMFSWGAD